MSKKSFPYFIILILSLILNNANAQVEVLQKDALDKIKDGNTHILVNDLNFTRSVEFYRIFKKYWTLTKSVEFMKYDDLNGNIIDGDTYFALQTLRVTSSNGATAEFMYINLFLPNKAALRSQKSFRIGDGNSIAKIHLSRARVNLNQNLTHENYNAFDFDGEGADGASYLCNWNPGTIKNYLQRLTALIETGKKWDFTDDIIDKQQLPLLKTQPVYFTNDILNYLKVFFGSRHKNETEADRTTQIHDLFEDYKFDYKLITDKDLEDKILADTEPFYYIVFVGDTERGKLFAVINSRTGQPIYSRCRAQMFSLTLKSSDLKDLYKAIK